MIVAAVVSLFLQIKFGWDKDNPYDFAHLMLVTVGLTTLAWLLVTWLTPPEPRDKLVAFYRRVRPGGPGWKPIKAAAGTLDAPSESLGTQFYNWILGCTLIYATLFGIGKIIFKEWLAGSAFIAVAVVASALISLNLSRADWNEPPISD